MKYAKTKHILHVMQLLSHRFINNTLIYTQLISFQEEDSFVSKVPATVAKACRLVEEGFEYVCDYNGNKVFRKRKYPLQISC